MHRIENYQGMKYKLFFFTIIGMSQILYGQNPCDLPNTATTVFQPQPLSASLSLEMALRSFKAGAKGAGIIGGTKGKKPWLYFDWTAFYFRTFNATQQAAAFLPHSQSSVIIGQDNDSAVSSAWVGIVSPLSNPFKSRISFFPERTTTGGTMRVLIDFGGLFPDIDTALKDMYTSLYVPITHVKHNLNLTEEILGGQGMTTGFRNFREALNNPAYEFGKIPPNEMIATAIDDMQWRLGWNFLKSKKFFSSVYFCVFIPEGIRPSARFLFEPVIGNGGHWAPGFGYSGSYIYWQNPKASSSIFWEFRWNYIIEAIERRTLDLNNGDWSRYLLVADVNNLIFPVPGVNFFTRDLSVTPSNMIDFILSVNYVRDPLTFEVGYDLWWRQTERVTLEVTSQPVAFAVKTFRPLPGEPITVVIYDITGCCPKTSLINATICQAIPGIGALPSDAQPIPISNADLNLRSATKSSVIFMKLFGGFTYSGRHYPGVIGIAGSSEFIGPKNALLNWGIWLKAGYSF